MFNTNGLPSTPALTPPPIPYFTNLVWTMSSIPTTLISTVCPILYSQFIKRKGAEWAVEELIEILKPKLDGIAEGIIQLRYGDYQSALSHFQVKSCNVFFSLILFLLCLF